LAREAIERFADYDDWFVREVEKGLAQIDRARS
jgi:predicted transcriptional regulator